MKSSVSYTFTQLAEFVQGSLIGNSQGFITGVADLESATPSDISFFANDRYQTKLRATQAGLIIATQEHVTSEKNFLVVTDPSAAFQKMIELFAMHKGQKHSFEGIHTLACIDPSANIAPQVSIGPYAVIGKNCQIGAGTIIYSGCVIERDTIIGAGCVLHAHTTVREECILKERVILQPGAVIGSCGFGYLSDKTGKHTKLSQLGNVIIEDDVEIGAGTTIDRGRFQATRIGMGTKIDNLVQIGHAVEIGKHCIIVAQTGIAGSTKIGDHVIIGGQVGISGHIEIVSHVAIAAKSGVTKSLLQPGKYAGHPAIPLQEYNRLQVMIKKNATSRSETV